MRNSKLGSALVASLALPAVLAVSAALAGGQVHEQMRIKVATDGGDAEVVNIDNLAVGETREIETESGKLVLVSRDEKGLVIDVDGELVEVDLPSTDDHDGIHGQHRVMVMKDVEETVDGERRVIVKRKHVTGDATDIDVDEILSELDLQDVDSEDVIVIRKKVEIEQDGAL